MAFSDITVKQERRLCVVNGRMGYFHCWEHYSRPVEPSPMIGGAPDQFRSRDRGVPRRDWICRS